MTLLRILLNNLVDGISVRWAHDNGGRVVGGWRVYIGDESMEKLFATQEQACEYAESIRNHFSGGVNLRDALSNL